MLQSGPMSFLNKGFETVKSKAHQRHFRTEADSFLTLKLKHNWCFTQAQTGKPGDVMNFKANTLTDSGSSSCLQGSITLANNTILPMDNPNKSHQVKPHHSLTVAISICLEESLTYTSLNQNTSEI